TWSPDGIVFAQGAGIMRVGADGGTPELIVKAGAGELLHGPVLLPGGRAVIFTIGSGLSPEQWNRATIFAQTIGSNDRKRLVEGGADARYVPTGHLVYALGGTLFALPFDPRRLETTGTAVSILEGVARSTAGSTGGAQFSFSE